MKSPFSKNCLFLLVFFISTLFFLTNVKDAHATCSSAGMTSIYLTTLPTTFSTTACGGTMTINTLPATSSMYPYTYNTLPMTYYYYYSPEDPCWSGGVARTTNWSTGQYNCGGAARCYQGTCHSCPNVPGSTLLWNDNSPNAPVAGQGGDVCWRKGAVGASCDTACASFGGCVAANWNDSINWCDVCKYHSGGGQTCGGDYYSGDPLVIDNARCYYRTTAAGQSCSSPGSTAQRFCVCQW